MEIMMETTSRGFSLIKFKDIYGDDCSLQKSSLAFEDTVWLGLNNVVPKVLASQAEHYGIVTEETTGWVEYPLPEGVHFGTRMHLDKELAKMLVKQLQVFIETGGL